MKNTCRCALLDYMLGQLAAKRKEAARLGQPLNNPCVDEILRSGDAICCTMVFIAFMSLCCDGKVSLSRELQEMMLNLPCRHAESRSTSPFASKFAQPRREDTHKND